MFQNTRSHTRRLALSIGLIASAAVPVATWAALDPGTAVVADFGLDILDSSAPIGGALIAVNPATGARSLFSTLQGSAGETAVALDVAISKTGKIVVAALDVADGALSGNVLFSINPDTGQRTLLTDFADAGQGETGTTPYGVAFEQSGDILAVTNPLFATGEEDNVIALFRINPVTGDRTRISDLGTGGGDTSRFASSVAVEANGKIVVVMSESFTTGVVSSLLLRVDPATGATTTITDFSDTSDGPVGASPSDVSVEPSGNILVADSSADPFGSGTTSGVVFRVDPVTGQRTIAGENFQGAGDLGPTGTAIEVGGDALVIANQTLFRVDVASGDLSAVSTFTSTSGGQPGALLAFKVAVVPEPVTACTNAVARGTCMVNGVRRTPCLGTSGPDRIVGSAKSEVILGLGGDDTIEGRNGDDLICGGDGNDRLIGGRNNDRLFGGFGDDILLGDKGNDTLDGGGGADRAEGGAGTDTCVAEDRVGCELN